MEQDNKGTLGTSGGLKKVTGSMEGVRKSILRSSQSLQELYALLQSLKKAAATSAGSFKRGLAPFDEINRLPGKTGSAAKQVDSLTDSVARLGTTLGLWNLDTLPASVGGWADKLKLSAERILENYEASQRMATALSLVSRGIWDFSDSSAYFDLSALQMSQRAREAVGSLDLTQTQLGSLSLALNRGALEFDSLGGSAGSASESVRRAWTGTGEWFGSQVAAPVNAALTGAWAGVTQAAQTAWEDTRGVFGNAGSFFETTFSNAWNGVLGVFSNTGQVGQGIRSGVLAGVKSAVNGLIDGINDVVAEPFQGLQTALGQLRTVRVGGMFPFAGINWRTTALKIPHLAQGAVLPPNQPFLAMVGDQKQGTNVEAPLATIQKALALALEETGDRAGQQMTVALLGQILEAVRGIRIGDDLIAAASSRYSAREMKMLGI